MLVDRWIPTIGYKLIPNKLYTVIGSKKQIKQGIF